MLLTPLKMAYGAIWGHEKGRLAVAGSGSGRDDLDMPRPVPRQGADGIGSNRWVATAAGACRGGGEQEHAERAEGCQLSFLCGLRDLLFQMRSPSGFCLPGVTECVTRRYNPICAPKRAFRIGGQPLVEVRPEMTNCGTNH